MTLAFMNFTNIKTFMCMSGLSSWGSRMQLMQFQAYDIVRGATMFGTVSVRAVRRFRRAGRATAAPAAHRSACPCTRGTGCKTPAQNGEESCLGPGRVQVRARARAVHVLQ